MESGQDLLRFGPFRVDTFQRLWRGDQRVELAARPLAVLCYLAERPGQVVAKQELLKELWAGTYVTRAVLKVAVRTIREALGEDAAAPQYIETVGREGYRFIASTSQPHLSLGSSVQSLVSKHQSPVRSDVQTLDPRRQTLDVPVVGRESELMQLHGWFEKALQGQRQLVFVTGEPGIGKTTVVDAFRQRLETGSLLPSLKSQAPSLWLGRGQCVEQYGQGEAYLPILEALSRLGQGPEGRLIVEVLRRYAPTWLAQLPALLEAEERRELQATVQGATQQRMLRELAEALEALAAERPLILILEDLHWSDASTLEALAYVGQRRDHARLLVVGTYRPIEVIMQGHRLKGVKQELEAHGQCTELRLELLTVDDVNAYLTARFADGSLPVTLAAEVHRRTEGNALFMVNLVEEWVRQGIIARDGQWRGQEPLVVNHTPETVRQVIEKQLERLEKQEQRLLETASVAGTDFTVAAVAAGLKGDLDEIEDHCEAVALQGHFLEERGIAEWPDGTVSGRYGFRHALYQNVLYDRIAEMRRMRLHRSIGERLEAGYGEQAREIAAELAVHFEQGRDYSRAVQYRLQAGQRASQRSAHVEAVNHLGQGLELLKTLPDTPERTQQELALQLAFSGSLMATKGFSSPEAEKANARALELGRQVGETPEFFPALFGLWVFYVMRAEYHTAQQLGEQLLTLAQNIQDPTALMWAHHGMGVTLLFQGEVVLARAHQEQGIILYKSQQHNPYSLGWPDAGVVCLDYTAWALLLLGYPDQALKRVQEALALAQELSHPFSLAYALNAVASVHLVRGERQAAQERAETLIALSAEQGFTQFAAYGTFYRGRVLTELGQVEEGIAQMQQGLAALRAMGVEMGRTGDLTTLAAAYAKVGRVEKGLAVVAETLVVVDKTRERRYEAELYRLRGELTLQSSVQRLESSVRKSEKWKGKSEKLQVPSTQHLTPSTQAEAEAYFLKAIEVAQRQQAKSLELRATTSLARLWQQRGKRNEARDTLAKVYNWFTEGFDTKDLQEAKALLEQLHH